MRQALQANLDLGGASNLVSLTHRVNKKKRKGVYDDCLYMVCNGDFEEGSFYSIDEALERVEQWIEYEFTDCYFTPNGYNYPRLKQGGRGLQNVSKIDCLFVDLDYYGTKYSDLSASELLDQILTDLPWLPSPSVVLDSGRGCWFLWIFDRSLAINKTTRKSANWLPQWQVAQHCLNDLLAKYGADPRAVDASRYMRMPETMNSKNGSIARSWVSTDSKGRALNYKFTDLKKLFNEQTQTSRKRSKGSGRPHGLIDGVDTLLNAYTLSHNRMKDFETLIKKRGGKRLNDMRKRFIDCYLVEAAHYCKSRDTLLQTVDHFVDEYIENPKEYKTLYRQLYARKIERTDYVRRQLSAVNVDGTKVREFEFLKEKDRSWNQNENRFIHSNKRIVRMLEITQGEMRKVSRRPYLVTLINKSEKALRRRERDGSMPRTDYQGRSENRRTEALRLLQDEALSQRQIAMRLNVSRSAVQYYLS
jgi:hypothetical protein